MRSSRAGLNGTGASAGVVQGTAKVVNYDCDKGGNRTEIIFHDTATTATFGYDTRDRCPARPGPQRRDGVRVRPADGDGVSVGGRVGDRVGWNPTYAGSSRRHRNAEHDCR